ncbi:Ig-like domain-containing protein [Niallia sp. NCCP-28]|uniref:Ig-like domain-containing protein n=1 Tax=Niallia sp. NCCP-28 TaxID=2934712 RepID=UPI00208AF551|nr:Ig-like domain-containing protein [Niallia sp. NCCP-28]GKU80810.1 hypothetical protein NCCP28_02060 [Niallia sp. NCCP-28]
MRKNNIFSCISIGLISLALFASSATAKENTDTLSSLVIENPEKKPLTSIITNSSTFKQLAKEMQSSPKKTNNIGKISTSSNDYILEKEPNNDFPYANTTSYDKTTFGQLLPYGDIDFHKVVVPKDGVLLVGGASYSYSIDLQFVAVQKDFVNSNKLVYIGYDYNDGVEVQGYQAKAGTYYIGVIDGDYEYDYDDNTENDFYGIAPAFFDNVAPAKPKVNKVDNNDKVVTGKAEANSTVTVKVGSKKIGSAKTTSKGAFTAKIAVQKAGIKISASAKDSSGNVSGTATVTVMDVVPPNKPTINKVDSNDKVVTGKAEAGSAVTVKAGSKTLGSNKASSKGNYSVKIKAQKKGTVLTVTAKDKAGNVSSKATKTVVKP